MVTKPCHHCHVPFEARNWNGKFCLGCNTLLGFIETPGRLDAALDYMGQAALDQGAGTFVGF